MSTHKTKPNAVTKSPSKPLVPEDTTGAVLHRAVSMYSGSVPPPEIVAAYEKLVPGSAERFLQMAEKEQQQRIEAQRDAQSLSRCQEENASTNFRWGLFASTFLMVILFVFMFFCATLQLENVLLAALSIPAMTAIGGIIAQFMWKRALNR